MNSNPYPTGGSVGNTTAFAGRKDILTAVNEILESDRQSIVLVGQRRIGKTSVLKEFEARLSEEPQYLPVYFSFEAYLKKESLLSSLCRNIQKAVSVHNNHKPVSEFDEFRDWLQRIVLDNIKSENKKLVFLLDECEAALNGEGTKSIFRIFRESLSELSNCLKFVYTLGCPISNLGEESFYFNQARLQKISLLKNEDTRKIILLSWTDNDKTLDWEEEAIQRVISLTQGHPYITQSLCEQIWNKLCRGTQEPPRVEFIHVENAIEDTLSEVDKGLNSHWGSFSPQQRFVAFCLANQSKCSKTDDSWSIRGSELALKKKDICKAIEQLNDEDWIEKSEKNEYCFKVELVRLWIADKSPRDIEKHWEQQNSKAKKLYDEAFATFALVADLNSSEDSTRCQNAEKSCRDAIAENSNYIEAKKLLANILLQQGKSHELVEHLITFCTEHSEATSNWFKEHLDSLDKLLADILLKQGKSHEFVEHLITFCPTAACGLLIKLGQQSFDAEQKILCWEKILKIEPQHYDVRYSLAELLIHQEQLVKAQEHLEKLYLSQPSDKKIKEQLVKVLLKLAQTTKIQADQLSYCKRILDIEPSNQSALSLLTHLNDTTSRISKLLELLRMQKTPTQLIQSLVINIEYEQVLFSSVHNSKQIQEIHFVKLLKSYQKKLEFAFSDSGMRSVVLQYSNKLVNVYFLDHISPSLAICFIAERGKYGLGRFIPECEKKIHFLIERTK